MAKDTKKTTCDLCGWRRRAYKDTHCCLCRDRIAEAGIVIAEKFISPVQKDEKIGDDPNWRIWEKSLL